MSIPILSTVDLSGDWRFALDPMDCGIVDRWFAPESTALALRCALPGSIQQQGFGDDITLDTPWTADRNGSDRFETNATFAPYRVPGNIKYPYWLQPRKYYAGPAWFAREVEVPNDWQGRRVVLHLERPHWQTRVWVGGVEVGPPCDSLSTPHEHDLSHHLTPGRHTITLRVDNRIIHKVGPNAHSVSDHTQGNWNGVVGRLELRALPKTRLESVSWNTDLAAGQLRLTARVASDAAGRGYVRCRGIAKELTWDSSGEVEFLIPTDGLSVWSEHAPHLHTFEMTLHGSTHEVLDRRALRHGVREIETSGTRIFVNGLPTLLRGTLECCIFPLTGYPPTAIEPWRRIMSVLKQHGLNHLRFHSWCPPEAAFDAADEAGVYLQIECATWPNQGATLGSGGSLDEWVYAEGRRIIAAFGHHPSFVMLACGNEPAGDRHVEFLEDWLRYWKKTDPQRFHTGGAGWPENAESQFHIRFQPRIQHWGAGLTSSINSKDVDTTADYGDQTAAFDRPTITHEIGQWCAYPDLAAIEKYQGTLRPTAFEIVRDSLQQRGLAHLARDFLMASGKLQALAYKEEIEAQLRTPGLGGFQLLDLHDFPGQGTALVGVLDAFWDGKGYITANEFQRFCGPAVLLARIGKRVYGRNEVFRAEIELSYFKAEPVRDCTIAWRIETESGQCLAGGEFKKVHLQPGELTAIGRIAVPLVDVVAPAAIRLVVEAHGVAPANDWDLWVYDPTVDGSPDVLITTELGPDFIEATRTGRPVLLCPPRDAIASPVALGFSPIFWNTLFTNGQAPHTLGLLIHRQHPALARFPTTSHSNWQWQEPLRHAACLMLDRLADQRAAEPIIRVIDDWNENRSLALLLEVRVGQSQVIVSGIDLAGDLLDRPASRQLRESLLVYLSQRTALPASAPFTIEDLIRLIPAREQADGSGTISVASSYGRLDP